MSLEARWFAYFPSVRSLTSCYVVTMFKTDMWGMFEQSTMLIFEERENPQLNCILQTIVSQFCPNFIQVLFSPSLNCQTSLTCLVHAVTAAVARYEFSHTTDRLWRKNRNPNPGTFGLCPGVDLNRNFGYKWGHEVRSRDTRLIFPYFYFCFSF